jgi:hypothetical protein
VGNRVRDYNEGDGFIHTAGFYDDDWADSSPATARYRIDCLTTKREVRDWTEITSPTQSVDIVITPADNAIINTRNKVERKEITVQSNYGTDTQKSEVMQWDVKNILGIT